MAPRLGPQTNGPTFTRLPRVARLANRAAVDLAPFAVHPFAVSRARPRSRKASREPKDAAPSVVSRSLRAVQIRLIRRADFVVSRSRAVPEIDSYPID
jgi:hypothetical protein